MDNPCFSWVFAVRIRIWLSVLVLGLLTACSGGGSDSSGVPGSTLGVLNGQVVKGLTSGSTVSLYSLTDNGQRTFLTSAVTNAQGTFSLGHVMQVGRVYLLEAVGGQYVNEISHLTESLTTPMRAVFVASGVERYFSISAVSEAAVIEAEQLSAVNKWSASSIGNITSLVNAAFGLPSPFDLRFVDLTTLAPGSSTNFSDAEIEFSFQAGNFAGFWYELRLRTPGLTLAQGLTSFHAVMLGNYQDENLPIALIAGLVRFVENVPALAQTKSSLFTSIGLPPDASSTQFAGAESSGQSLVSLPNWTFRFLSPPTIASQTTTDTVFNSRGALIAYGLGATNPGAGFRHVGYASVADVFGTSETAIGRWNRGYYFPQGITYDSVNNRFLAQNATLTALTSDMVYASGIPATNLPTCSTVVMAPQAQTRAFKTYDNSRTLTLDASSRIVFQFIDSSTLVRYNIVLRDDLGNLYAFATPGGLNASWQGSLLATNREFGASNGLPLPTGELFDFHAMLAGNGGTKAVVTVTTNTLTRPLIGISAAFAQVSATQDCQSVSFSGGAVNPIPATGDYYVSLMGGPYFMSGINFFANGTPNIIGVSGATAGSGVEKSGNDVAGIGILVPPFSYANNASLVPQTYYYFQSPANPVLPQTGTYSYRLVASTPLLIKTDNQLISSTNGIQAADLSIFFDQNPLGTTNTLGTCQLNVNSQSIQWTQNFYFPSSGYCFGSSSAGETFDGGITSGDNRYAVFKYIKYYSASVRGEASLLFEKIP